MLLLAIALVLVVGADVVHAQPAVESRVETVWIPMTEKRLLGSPRTLRLEATLYRPGASSAVPLLVFNHGSTGRGRGSLGGASAVAEGCGSGSRVLFPGRGGRVRQYSEPRAL